jgi:glycosyltransferase involved in cell wall biosynthesis
MPTSLSIVIPTYNRSLDLARALESVAVQTQLPYEVIVCDDGSEEDIRSVVDRFTPRLNVSYMRISKSGGPGRPRNHAVAAATGSWISFLDSDDWWYPDRIEALQPLLREPVDVVYHRLDVKYFSSTPLPWKRLRHVGYDCGPDPLRTMVTRGNPLPNSAAVVRRPTLVALGGITEDYTSVEDFDTWLRIAEAGGIFRFVKWDLGAYAVTESNISKFSWKQLRRQRALFERHLPMVPETLRPIAASNFDYLIGSYAARLRMIPMAERYLAKVKASCTLKRWALATAKRGVLRTPLVRMLPR